MSAMAEHMSARCIVRLFQSSSLPRMWHATLMSMITCALCAFSLMIAGNARADELPEPTLAEADAAVLIDKGGNVLYQKNPTKREHPASITKVMTAMVALDSGHELSDIVDMVAPDLGFNSQMGDYSTGDKIELEELMRVMLVYSGNDAAYNVARFVGGSEEEFVKLMNKKAAEIGMEHTHFNNSHGLEDDDHYTCAYDIALMGRYALEHYPFIAQAVLSHTVDAHLYGEVISLNSTDRLLDTFPGIRGIKTGAIIDNYTFLGASGRGNVQLYVSVLGCPSFSGRFDDAVELMEWGYANYSTRKLDQQSKVSVVAPYAFDLGLKAVLSKEGNLSAEVWPQLQDPVASDTQLSRGLLDVGRTNGWTNWQQEGCDLGYEYFSTRATPIRASAWPVFSLPLFTSLAEAEVGEAA